MRLEASWCFCCCALEELPRYAHTVQGKAGKARVATSQRITRFLSAPPEPSNLIDPLDGRLPFTVAAPFAGLPSMPLARADGAPPDAAPTPQFPCQGSRSRRRAPSARTTCTQEKAPPNRAKARWPLARPPAGVTPPQPLSPAWCWCLRWWFRARDLDLCWLLVRQEGTGTLESTFLGVSIPSFAPAPAPSSPSACSFPPYRPGSCCCCCYTTLPSLPSILLLHSACLAFPFSTDPFSTLHPPLQPSRPRPRLRRTSIPSFSSVSAPGVIVI